MRALVASVVVVTVSVAGLARAGNERIEIVARIDDAVHAIATALDGDANLDEAQRQSQRMRDLLGKLETSTGNHPRAADILAHYKTYADKLDGSIAVLRRMKQAAKSADGVLGKCIKADAELSAAIDATHARPDVDPAKDVATLEVRGDTYGQTWKQQLASLASVDRAIAADAATSKLTLTDGYWMTVSSQLEVAAKSISAAWSERYQPVIAACEPLGLGREHPQLAPVLDELRKRAAANRSAAQQLAHDYTAWTAQVKRLRELAVKARDDMREAVCGATDMEMTNRVENVADAAARELVDQVATVEGEATRLRGMASRAPAVITQGLRSTIASSIGKAEARGRANPKLKTALAAIAKQRAASVKGLACAYEDVGLGAADCKAGTCRIACVKVEPHSCTVVEIAADNEHATGDATAASERDQRGLEAWYTRDRASLFAKHPNLRKCEAADARDFVVTASVTTYPACAKLMTSDLGEILVEFPANAPEP